MSKSARLISLEILYKIFYEGAYSNLVTENTVKDDIPDKAFISALVYGVTEQKITLDYFVNKYIKSSVKPKIRIILWLGIYQLLYMDKIPSSAAINESVKLTREIKQDYYSKLVNAVLHKIDSDRKIPDEAYVKYSVNPDLINMWYKQYGEQTVNKFLPCINSKPPLFLIPNTLYVNSDELLYELECDGINGEAYSDYVLVEGSGNLFKSKAFVNGLFYVEDLSSFICARALGAKEGDAVLDMCAAPGGKSFTISLGMKNTGSVYAYDLYEHRCNLIKSGAQRLGINNITALVNDAAVINETIAPADKILCDVPCSGFGIIRRKPEIKYKELDSVKKLPQLQYDILETSSGYLKNGGTIIYSTCTLNKKENERVVDKFLQNNQSFSLIEEKTTFPSFFGGDGFYYAKMTKNEN